MNNRLPTLFKNEFILIEKPKDTEYKNGWVYQTVTLIQKNTDDIYSFTGISHTKTWSSVHKKRNQLIVWAEKSNIGETCCLLYNIIDKGILGNVSFADNETTTEKDIKDNIYKNMRKSIRELADKYYALELVKDDPKDGKLHKRIRRGTAAIVNTVKKAMELNTDNADHRYYNKIKEMVFYIDPETKDFELYYSRDFDADKIIKFHEENPGLYKIHDKSDLLSEWLKGKRYIHYSIRSFNIHINDDYYEKRAKEYEHITLISDYKLVT